MNQLDRIERKINRLLKMVEPVSRAKSVRLTSEAAEQIRMLHKRGATYAALAREFRTSEATISRVVKNKIWKQK